jgi:hypothetical protein
MKLIPTLISLLLLSTAQAQLISDLPKDESGKLYKAEVVQLDNMPKNELFSAFSQLFADMFTHVKYVTQLSDKDNGIIIVKSYDKARYGLNLWFTLKVECRDNRFKAELYDFYYTDTHNGIEYQVENYLSKRKYYKKNGQPRAINEDIRIETLKKIDEILNTLKTDISKYKTKDW